MAEPEPVAPAPGRPVRVLFVCTANRIRSPFAEAKGRSLADSAGLAIEFASAGTDAVDGAGAVVNMVEVAAKLGIDLGPHRSRRITQQLLAGADMVVTMTGEQVLEVTSIDPAAGSRTVTLRELAAAGNSSPVPRWDPQTVQTWLAPVVDRPISQLLGGGMDIEDPIGGRARAYRRAAAEISDLLEVVLAATP